MNWQKIVFMFASALVLGAVLSACTTFDVINPLLRSGKLQPALRMVAVIANNEATKLDFAEAVDAATAQGQVFTLRPNTVMLDPQQQEQLVRAIIEGMREPAPAIEP